MGQKKLMLLGGLRYLLPVIKKAHELGIYVITCDYIPDNIAHKYSDEYHNISIIDKEAVLKLAQKLQIDGIMSFAVDPGVVTAAYVAEKMGLPFQASYKSAKILQDKGLFRNFLRNNGFNVPIAKSFAALEDGIKNSKAFNWPVIVKPVDSAGSKGVTRVDDTKNLEEAIKYALSKSIKKEYIIEDFLDKKGLSSGAEIFVVNGELKYAAYYDQFFDNESVNPYTPSGECWPSVMPQAFQDEISNEIQRLIDLLKLRSGIFNVECRVCTNNKAYIMEVSPRGGGNRLAEILNYAADVDIIENEIKRAVEIPITDIHQPNYKGYYAILILHSSENGIFQGLEIDYEFETAHIIEKDIWVNEGDQIKRFDGANQAIGTLFLKFTSSEEMFKHMENQSWMKIMTK